MTDAYIIADAIYVLAETIGTATWVLFAGMIVPTFWKIGKATGEFIALKRKNKE